MEIRINNKDMHRYKYVRRKVRIKKKDSKEEDKVSFGEIFLNIKELKDQGLISVSSVEASISKAAQKYNEAITASGKLGQKKNIVDVTNRFNNVPTTGIIMNTLPYVLMIALCGVALIAFVGFKRRRLQK